jgi:hypothetical protein
VKALAAALLLIGATAHAQSVWVIDDGEKIAHDAVGTPFSRGQDNPVWSPGQPIRLFAMRGETIAFQVVVEGPAEGVTVEVELPGVGVERFVEHFFPVKRSSTSGHAYSLGWAEGSGPADGKFTGELPDALIPVELAPSWEPWPMRVGARQNGIVWVDLTVPPEHAPGPLRGSVVVRAGASTLATLPLELEVLPSTMPARPVGTLLFYDRGSLEKRIGHADTVEKQLVELLRRHRLTPLHGVGSAEDVRALAPLLDGDDVIVLGTYGTLGDATPEALAAVEKIADELAAQKLFDRAEVILYAEDEDCRSPRGAGWRQLLAGSRNPNARRVRVAWTCGDDPAIQPVDVPIVGAPDFDPARAAAKETWIYNGYRPATGTLLTDTEAVSPRVDGWIAAMASIPRWFFWETTFWYDGNPGGRGPYDPFATAETFHNRDGEAAMGDGVLVYPGRQIDRFGEHSIGFDGVLPSIRLKNLRRGVEDAGYYRLARASAPDQADAIARALLPRILAEAPRGAPPSWSEHGKPFFEARRALSRLIVPDATPGPTAHFGAGPYAHPRAPLLRKRYLAVAALLVVLLAGWAMRRRATRASRPAG